MIEVLLVCSSDGSLKSCNASGHAGFAVKGKDIVCAAVSSLLRTAIQVLEKTNGIVVKTETTSRGKLAFSVEDSNLDCKNERLICTADFIRCGIKSLSNEYPKNVQLRELFE
ncbi:MAG: ribosomal-processing cysteine protease Prp [Treponema sp.]